MAIDYEQMTALVNDILEVFEDHKVDVPEALGAAYMLSGISMARALERFKENTGEDEIDIEKYHKLRKWGDALMKDVIEHELKSRTIEGEILSSAVH
jgi:hypothetical protein